MAKPDMSALVCGEPRSITTLPTEDSRTTVLEGVCPKCKTAPFEVVRASDIGRAGHDVQACDIACRACRVLVGQMRERVSTIFGLEEDFAVLNGRPRVYG